MEFYPDPKPTLEKKPDPDPTLEKQPGAESVFYLIFTCKKSFILEGFEILLYRLDPDPPNF